MLIKLSNDRPSRGVFIRNLRKLSHDTDTNIQRYRDHYDANPVHLDSSNILYKILTGTALGTDLSMDEFIRSTATRADQVAGVLGICNHRSKGTYQSTNSFYGKPFKEVIVFNSAPTDALSHILEQYRDVSELLSSGSLTRCIRVLYHTSTDVGVRHLDGTSTPSDEGYAVIEIDPIKLALAYRVWRLGEGSSTADGIELTMGNFLQQYIIPGMVNSHVDIALWNRLLVDSTGITSRVSMSNNLPFYMLDPEVVLPSVERSFDSVMRNWTKGVSDLYSSIPLISSYTVGHYTQVKGLPVNAQTEWVHLLVQYNYIRFALFHISANQRDQGIYSEIKRWISRVYSNRHLTSGHHRTVRLHLQSLLHQLMDDLV